jgi:hypothetical protein
MKKMWFSVILKGQAGPRTGELTFQTDETDLSGYLTIAGRKSYLQGKVLRKNHYVASLRLKTGDGEEECDMVLLQKDNGVLVGGVICEWGCWPLEGTALREPDFYLSPLEMRQPSKKT